MLVNYSNFDVSSSNVSNTWPSILIVIQPVCFLLPILFSLGNRLPRLMGVFNLSLNFKWSSTLYQLFWRVNSKPCMSNSTRKSFQYWWIILILITALLKRWTWELCPSMCHLKRSYPETPSPSASMLLYTTALATLPWLPIILRTTGGWGF